METSLPQEPALPQLPAAPFPVPSYRDRSTGLTIFGVIEIAVGGLCALFIPLMLLGAAFSSKVPGGSLPAGSYVSGICTYAFIAAGFVTLGIGSMRARRWARALNLILSWAGLIGGTAATLGMALVLPSSFMAGFRQAARDAPNTPPISTAAIAIILTIMIVFFSVFFVLMPLAFLLFFRMKDVEETCRQRDPVERWTDRSPLPVIAASLMFAWGTVYSVLTAITTPVYPFFGAYLGGVSAAAVLIAAAALDAFLAVGLYRLRPLVWWIAVVAMMGKLSSTVLTYRRSDLSQLYAKMGWSADQLQTMSSNPMLHRGYPLVLTLVAGVAFLAYMLWIKRYFVAPSAPPLNRPETLYESPSSGTA